MNSEEIDTFEKRDIICPSCGQIHFNIFEVWDEDDFVICEYCLKEFYVMVENVQVYTTKIENE